jgi:intracellular multiplication protein IcmJ
MRHYPITLGVKRPNWGANPRRATGQVGPEAAEAVLLRDEHTCQCCGFRAEKYQQVLHLNGDERDFAEDNVLTTCVFCHQCFDLGMVDKMRSGMLIWLPEMSQPALHHLMRALYIARVTQGGLAEAARQTYDTLLKRGEEAKRRLGSSDPGALAIVLRDFFTHKQYTDAQERLEGIRLLPLDRRMIIEGEMDYNQFPQILAYWRSRNGPFAAMPAQDWPTLFADAGRLKT